MADTPRVTVPVEPRAHIVWNAERSEAVIFVDQEGEPSAWPLTAADDAHQASTGRSRKPGLGSALAEAFYEVYDDDDERPIQSVPLSALSAAPAPEGGAVDDEALKIATELHTAFEKLIYDLPKYLDAENLTDEENMIREAWITLDVTAHRLAALATREEAPAEAGEDYFSAGLVWEDQHIGRWVADVEEDGRAKAVLAAQAIGEDEDQAVARRELILSALRAQPPAREDAQPFGYWVTHPVGENPVFIRYGSFVPADDRYTVQPLYTHPAPDALRVAVEALEKIKVRAADDGTGSSVFPEIRNIASKALATLQAEQGAK